MKKAGLMVALMAMGMASNVFAAGQYDWNGVVKGPHGKDGGLAAIHYFDKNEGDHGICLASAAVGHTNLNANIQCDESSLDFPAGAKFNGFQVKSRDGLHLKYNMVKSEFIDALNRADIHYVG